MGDLIRVRTAMSVKLLASLAFCCLCISAEKTLACSDGYLEFEGACYGLMEGLDSVEEYSLTCEALGGALVSIHSAEENDFVLSLVPPNIAVMDTQLGLGLQESVREWNVNGEMVAHGILICLKKVN